jgi:Tol biopolymer transport system component/DNA-binding winged helix-turn-helix (wHTH) protein
MSNRSGHCYEFGAFRLEPAERLLLRDGAPVPLPPKAFAILVLLVERCGHVVGKEDLMRVAWPTTFVEENNLTQCIFVLRRALGGNGNGHSLIETVPKLGYRFLGPLRQPLNGAGENGSVRIGSRPNGVVTQPEQLVDGAGNKTGTETASTNPSPAAVTEAAPPAVRAVPGRKRALYLATAALLLVAAMVSYRLSAGSASPRVLDYVPISKDLVAGTYLFSDGIHLYFTVSGTDGIRLAEMSATGGDPALLSQFPPGLNLQAADLAPGGAELLALSAKEGTSERELWIVPLPAGSPWPLGNLKAHSAGWSPDGKKIVFAYENNLYTAQSDGSSVGVLTHLSGPAWDTRWSPDGQRIRFRIRNEPHSYWEVAAQGGPVERILDEPEATMWDGRWTADGKYFVFPMNRDGRTDLWAIPESPALFGTKPAKPIRLTSGPLDLSSPVPSGDGKHIFAVGVLHRVEILRHNPGTNSFTPFLPGVSADSLAFSGDGQWVVYSTVPDHSLWRSRIDGSERMQLTFPPMQALLPRWSPDGKTIAFAASIPGQPWKIYGIPAHGGQPQRLAEEAGAQANPTWSPDGNVLAYAGAPWETDFATSSTAVRCLDLRTRQISVLAGSQGLWSPRWSPDGRYIVAETNDSKELKLFDVHMRQWRSLVRLSNPIVGYTAWSKDSRFLYFNAYGGNTNAVYRVAVTGSNSAERVLDLKSVIHADTLGQWFTLDPTDSPLLLQDTSISRIYALDVQYP